MSLESQCNVAYFCPVHIKAKTRYTLCLKAVQNCFSRNKKKFAWLSSCCCCTDRTQNLPEPAPDNVLFRVLQIHPNRFTFSEVISERVNIIRARSKVNPA